MIHHDTSTLSMRAKAATSLQACYITVQNSAVQFSDSQYTTEHNKKIGTV